MAQATWAVKLIDKGRTLQVHVQAHTQAEARTIAEHQYPGYKAMSAQVVNDQTLQRRMLELLLNNFNLYEDLKARAGKAS